MKRLSFLCLSLVLVAGCAPLRQDKTVHYVCDNRMDIQADYAQHDMATLRIDGKTHVLRQTISASGARYAADSGVKPGVGLVWWSKGKEASLYELAADSAGEGVLIATCSSAD